MAAKQRTVRIEDDLWVQLKNIAAIQNKTCTELINEDIRARVSNNLPVTLQIKVREAVQTNLEKYVRDGLIEAICSRVVDRIKEDGHKFVLTQTQETVTNLSDNFSVIDSFIRLDVDEPSTWSEYVNENQDTFYPPEDRELGFNSKDNKTVKTVETDSKPATYLKKKVYGNVELVKDSETAETVETVNNEIKKAEDKSKETVEIVETVKNREVSKKDKVAANLAKFKRYSSLDNRKSYSDGYVAAEEGLKKPTINRYRKGARSPKQDFIDRWGLSWNGNGWVKNLEE